MIIKQQGKKKAIAVIFTPQPKIEAMTQFPFAVSFQGTRGKLYRGGIATKVDDNTWIIQEELCRGAVNFKAFKEECRKAGFDFFVDNWAGNQVMIR